MERVHALPEGEKRPVQGQRGFLQLWNVFRHPLRARKAVTGSAQILELWKKFTHPLRVRKCQDGFSTDFCSYGTNSRTS
jgi:hypothetical protein